MKRSCLLVLALITTFWSCRSAEEPPEAEPEPTNEATTSSSDPLRARDGESVVMFFTHIEADARESFEGFVDFFSETMAEIGAEDEEFARQSQTFQALYPSEPNEDGTLTYVFVGDPLIDGTDTQIESILSRVYSEEEIEEHMKPWTEAQARPQDSYRFVQSRYAGTSE